MRKLLILLPLLVSNGCVHITANRVAARDTTNVIFHATSLLSNSTLKGLGVDAATKTSSNLLKITAGGTEPNAEAITASTEGLGTLIGSAVAASAKGMGAPSIPSTK